MLSRLIAHQILKSSGSMDVSHKERNKLLSTKAELSQTFFDQVRHSFRNRNPSVGLFQRQAEDVKPEFEQLLLGYMRDRNDKSFVKFTRDALALLSSKIKRQSAAVGGYLIFAEFSANDAEYVMVALLNVSAKPSFDEHMNLIATVAPDLDHLRHGVRARLDRVADNDEGVLQFLSSNKAGIVSQYFTDFVGCEELTKPATQASRLHLALGKWSNNNNLDESASNLLNSKAYEHVASCRTAGQPLTLAGLANALYPNGPEPLFAFLSEESHELAGECAAPPPSAMRKFIRFAYREDGLALEFDLNKWGNLIDTDNETKTVTIRNAPLQLIEQLSRDNEPQAS